MKKYISIILSIIMVLSAISISVTASEEISVYLNGEKLVFGQQPVIRNNRIIVPMRAILEKMETVVEWAENTKTINCLRDDVEVDLKIGSDVAMVNKRIKRLDTVPIIMGSSTMIPLRFIGEAFGADVSWDPGTKTANINIAPAKNPPAPAFDKMLIPVAISATATNQGSPEQAIDNDLTTRWGADCEEKAQSITVDFGEEKDMFGIGLAWYLGKGRVYKFAVSVSNDGENFTEIIPMRGATGKSESIENYVFPQTKARYVRVTGGGNGSNGYAHITEMRIYGPVGSPLEYVTTGKEDFVPPVALPDESTRIEVAEITASKESSAKAHNAADGDKSTRWSVNCERGEQWVQLDLGKVRLINTVGILWYKANQFSYTYRVEVSSDGENFKTVIEKGISKSDSDETDYISLGDRARYVRVVALGGKPLSANVNPSNQCHISEISIY